MNYEGHLSQLVCFFFSLADVNTSHLLNVHFFACVFIFCSSMSATYYDLRLSLKHGEVLRA